MAVLRCGFVCHRSSDGRGWRTGFTVVAGLGNIRANPLIFKGGIQPLHITNINTERGIYKLSYQEYILETVFPQCVYSVRGCLLYTSDAADDLLCVDLGGRR